MRRPRGPIRQAEFQPRHGGRRGIGLAEHFHTFYRRMQPDQDFPGGYWLLVWPHTRVRPGDFLPSAIGGRSDAVVTKVMPGPPMWVRWRIADARETAQDQETVH